MSKPSTVWKVGFFACESWCPYSESDVIEEWIAYDFNVTNGTYTFDADNEEQANWLCKRLNETEQLYDSTNEA